MSRHMDSMTDMVMLRSRSVNYFPSAKIMGTQLHTVRIRVDVSIDSDRN